MNYKCVVLRYKNRNEVQWEFCGTLQDVLYVICRDLYYIDPRKIVVEYTSSFKSQNGKYYMCFIGDEPEREYIIMSNEFVSLKTIDISIKAIALCRFGVEGHVITEYGVFD